MLTELRLPSPKLPTKDNKYRNPGHLDFSLTAVVPDIDRHRLFCSADSLHALANNEVSSVGHSSKDDDDEKDFNRYYNFRQSYFNV